MPEPQSPTGDLPATRGASHPDLSLRTVLSGASGLAASAVLDVRAEIEKLLTRTVAAAGGPPITFGSIEIHLVWAISKADLGQGPVEVVMYEPEFLYVVDIGFAQRAGVQVGWPRGIGFGVPDFPEVSTAKLRSIAGGAPGQLIYPIVVGELIGSVDAAADLASLKVALAAEGVVDVAVAGSFLEARCRPFDEIATAAKIAARVPGVGSMQPNRIVRLVDFSPGWSVTRIL